MAVGNSVAIFVLTMRWLFSKPLSEEAEVVGFEFEAEEGNGNDEKHMITQAH